MCFCTITWRRRRRRKKEMASFRRGAARIPSTVVGTPLNDAISFSVPVFVSVRYCKAQPCSREVCMGAPPSPMLWDAPATAVGTPPVDMNDSAISTRTPAQQTVAISWNKQTRARDAHLTRQLTGLQILRCQTASGIGRRIDLASNTQKCTLLKLVLAFCPSLSNAILQSSLLHSIWSKRLRRQDRWIQTFGY